MVTDNSRRLAILAVCAVEWQAGVADTLIETHDRIVGRIWREAAKLCDARIDDAKTAVYRTLRSFADLGGALLEARHHPAALEQAVSGKLGWDGLSDLVAVATRLTDTMSGNPLAHVAQGHGRLRRYAPRMLRALDIQAEPVATPLLEAAKRIRDGSSHGSPRGFLRPASKWHRHLDAQPKGLAAQEIAVSDATQVRHLRAIGIAHRGFCRRRIKEMIGPELVARIRHLFFAEHWKVGTIAAELRLHRDTVRRALQTQRFSLLHRIFFSLHYSPLGTLNFVQAS